MVADLRYAFRALAGSHGFTLAAVLTMALGIGASTTIFTLIYGVLLKPLPYGDPHRLVRLTEGRPGFTLNVSYPNVTDWRARNHVFEDMAIFNTLGTVVIPAVSGPADVFPAGHCEARLFSVFGLRPALGRFFVESDQQPSEALVVISDALWRRRFGSDRSVVGRAVRIDDDMATSSACCRRTYGRRAWTCGSRFAVSAPRSSIEQIILALALSRGSVAGFTSTMPVGR
jgi:putative ABC transport system permease protein